MISKEKQTEWINNICKYIRDNITEGISVDDISKRNYISRRELYRRFMLVKGIPPVSYINQVRIEYAKNLIMRRDVSIADIAQLLGYSSQSTFVRNFKKSTGYTPKEYLTNIVPKGE